MSTTSDDFKQDQAEPGIPEFEVFCDEIRKIYPEGDLKQTYKRLRWHMEHPDMASNPLSWEFLLDKFKQHIEEWNLLYGIKLGTQYFPTRSLSLRKNFYDFLGEKWYEREFGSAAGQSDRDEYLFGEFTMDYLKMKLEWFKKQIPDETG